MNELFDHALQNLSDSDMVGITIQNRVNQNDKPIGLSFRRKDQLVGDVIWSVLEKVTQSNARFSALDKLIVTAHSVRIPVGFGKRTIKRKGRPLSVMAQRKASVVKVKAAENCLANALIIAKAKVDNLNYTCYRDGRKLRPIVQKLLAKTYRPVWRREIPELIKFEEHFRYYKITVYQGLACEDNA